MSEKKKIISFIFMSIYAVVLCFGLMGILTNKSAQVSLYASSHNIYYNNNAKTVHLKRYSLKPAMYSYNIKEIDQIIIKLKLLVGIKTKNQIIMHRFI